MKVIFVIIFILSFPSVYSVSMANLLPSCNYNTYCEDFENTETCPDDCPQDEIINLFYEENGKEKDYPKPILKYSQIISKEEKPFPIYPILSFIFVIIFSILMIFLYHWINLHKGILQKKENINEKKKNLLYPKPERKF